jgi:hypothetical protein
MEKRPYRFLFVVTAAGYVALSLAVGSWVRTLIILPACAFIFLFTLYMAMGGWKRRRG